MKHSRILIIGGDGLIGSKLFAQLFCAGYDVYYTTRRASSSKRAIYFNLEASISDVDDIFWSFDTYILCAAVTSKIFCDRDREKCLLINFVRPVELGQVMHNLRKKLIFLSTDAIYGAERPLKPFGRYSKPSTSYAESKSLAEKKLLKIFDSGGGLSVIRLTKVLYSSHPLLAEWQNCAKKGIPIQAYSNVFMAPVSLNFVSKFITNVIGAGAPLYHCGGARAVAYSEFADLYLRKLRFNNFKIAQNCSSDINNGGNVGLCPLSTSDEWQSLQRLPSMLDDLGAIESDIQSNGDFSFE